MDDNTVKIAKGHINMDVDFAKFDYSTPALSWPEDMRHIRIIGCDDMRQCEVKYEFGVLYFRERDKEDGHFAMINMDKIFRRIFVALIKANDGMKMEDALEHGLKALEGFDYVSVANEELG